METTGGVPSGTADSIRQRVQLDASRILEIEKKTKHDVIAFLTHVEEQVGNDSRWLHLGMTSSDVLDTSFALQLKAASACILQGLEAYIAALSKRAKEQIDTKMIGRTHGIYAEPTTVGWYLGGHLQEMKRQMKRFHLAADEVAVGKISGAVGVYGNISPEVEAKALLVLGLSAEVCATQVVARDRHAYYFSVLAQIATSIERMATQIRHWQRSEVQEAREGFTKGQKGSSAMPHKKNPILSENLCGLARLVRSYAEAMLSNVPLWHERDISHSSVERVAAPDATTLVDFMLHRARLLVENLVFNSDALEKNLSHAGDFSFSESVMISLVKKNIKRQQAYEWVQACALQAWDDPMVSFKSLVKASPEISESLTSQEIDSCFDMNHHLRHTESILKMVLESEV